MTATIAKMNRAMIRQALVNATLEKANAQWGKPDFVAQILEVLRPASERLARLDAGRPLTEP